MICSKCGERIRGANKKKVKGVHVHKCRPQEVRDKESEGRLKKQYIVALAKADYNVIDNLVSPAFWKMFSKHFKVWSKTWRSPSTLEPFEEASSDEKRRLKNYFMDQVLLGKINPRSISIAKKGDI